MTANIPTNPEATYKHDGWQGCRHWLGPVCNVRVSTQTAATSHSQRAAR